MSGKKITDFNRFAMDIFKLAENRRLMTRFNKNDLLKRIKAMPTYQKAILEPNLCNDLDAEFARWDASKNLYVTMSLVRQLHTEAQANDIVINEAPVVEANEEQTAQNNETSLETESTDPEGGDPETDASEMLAGIEKYEKLVESRVNMKAFKTWIHDLRFIGTIGDRINDFIGNLQFKIYIFRNYMKDKKDRIDNAGIEVFQRSIDNIPDGRSKTLILILAFLILKIISFSLLAFIAFTRPTVLLDKLGIDGEVIPIPIE